MLNFGCKGNLNKSEKPTNNESISLQCSLSQAETSELSSSVYAAVMNDTSQASFAIKVN